VNTAPLFTPEYTDLVSLLGESVKRFAERPLFGTRGADGWQWTTYREFGSLVDRFRAGLAGLGVKRGDKVAVISQNRLEWVVGAHAVYSLGAGYVPMYEAQLDKEWQYILADSGATVCLVSTAAIEARVQRLRANLPALEHVVSFEGDAPGSYADLLARGASKPVARVIPAPSDLASLIYTSGTTGNPKGVCLTHSNLACNASAILPLLESGPDDRGISFLPWAHVFGGCVELNSCIITGASSAICGDPANLAKYIGEVKPTVLFAVPRVWNRIHAGIVAMMLTKPPAIRWMFDTAMAAKNKQRHGKSIGPGEWLAMKLAERLVFPKVRAAFGGRLRFAASGAAALSLEVVEFIENLGISLYEGYGMTESSGGTTGQPVGAKRLGSVGKPIPGVRIEIDRSVVGASGDTGEVVIYGHGIMSGYHNLEDVTRQTIGADGGLRTGDLGRLDADGYLYITGRTKELYKLENGKYVAPVPLEEQLTLSPYILQCVIFGADRPHNVALIVPDMAALRTWAKTQGIDADDEALLAEPKVRKLLETEVATYSKDFKGFERIKDFVIDTEELTIQNGMLTPTLKLKRSKVVAKYDDVFASLYPAAVAADYAEPRSSYIRELRPHTTSAARSA
jgi:long-chain acyl-CoA synthetase